MFFTFFTSIKHYTQRYTFTSMASCFLKILFQNVILLYKKKENTNVTMVLIIAGQYEYTLTMQTRMAPCVPK